MKLERYELKAERSLMVYEFLSDGPNGQITKIIQYSETNLKGLYNLAFGDKDINTGEIDDKIASNNGDSEKVLATVVSTVLAFTDRYQDAWVYATGSTQTRTRLYRMGITKYLKEILDDFELYGLLEGEWIPFELSVNYDAFLVKRKNK